MFYIVKPTGDPQAGLPLALMNQRFWVWFNFQSFKLNVCSECWPLPESLDNSFFFTYGDKGHCSGTVLIVATLFQLQLFYLFVFPSRLFKDIKYFVLHKKDKQVRLFLFIHSLMTVFFLTQVYLLTIYMRPT